MEVWNKDYRGVDEEMDNIYSENISTDCFSGIAEVYLYGNTYTQGNYNDISTQIESCVFPEDTVRFNDPQAPWAVDGGSYFVDGENETVRRSMNGGTYQAVISAVGTHDDIGALRFNADYTSTFNIISTDWDIEAIAYWQAETQRLESMQFFSMIISIAATAILVGIGVALALTGVGWVGSLQAFAMAASIAGATAFAIITGIMVVAQFNPVAASILGNILQLEDIVACAIIHGVCELLDDVLTEHYVSFGYQAESSLFREKVQPFLYGLYALTLDIHGTGGRLASSAYLKLWWNATDEEINYLLYDNYELAMMRGEAFNFCDPEIYYDGSI